MGASLEESDYMIQGYLDTATVVEDEIICLDVGGEKHFINKSLLARYPTTRLGRLARCENIQDAKKYCDLVYEDADIPEFFFDRNSDNFLAILDVYRTDSFHITTSGCALVMQKNLEYWGIDELLMEPCCALKYYPDIDTCVNEKQGDLKEKQKEKELAEEENFGQSMIGRFRSWLWNVMEYPWTSKLAQAMAFFSLGMVVVSTLTFVLSTMDDLQNEEVTDESVASKVLDVIDALCIAYFTLEYVVRFLCAPKKWKFFKQPMNFIDFLAIIPFYLALFLNSLEDIQIIGKAGKIIRLVRVMRILRIFKLVRHFAGLQSLLFTLRQAYKELGLLIILVGIGILTFSSLVYFAEKEDKNFAGDGVNESWTFVESFWWGLMTITTVGYDLNPKSFFGKALGGFCALCGIFIMTLPVPIVVNSFTSYYKNRLWRNEVAQKKRERQLAKKAKENEHKKFNMIRIMAAPMATILEDPPNARGKRGVSLKKKKSSSSVINV